MQPPAQPDASTAPDRQPQNQRLTESALARALGVSRQAINDLVKRGIIPKGDDNLIDLATARQQIQNHVRPSGKTATLVATLPAPHAGTGPGTAKPASTPAATPAAAPAAQPPSPPSDQSQSDSPGQVSFHIARTAREATEAAIARMKLRQMQADLLPRADAERAALQLGRTMRDALAALRRRIAPDLAAATGVEACETILAREHNLMLVNMAKALADMIPARPAAADAPAQPPAPAAPQPLPGATPATPSQAAHEPTSP